MSTVGRPSPMRTLAGPARMIVAVAAALALADGALVVLALPALIDELDASVEGAAAVIGVYTLVLALAAPAAVALRRRLGATALGAGGFAVFALASLGCGLVDELVTLNVLRGVQAAGGAAGLVAAFDLLDAAGRGRRMWVAIALVGTAVGPALGGTLTQLLDWRAIFLVQVPVVGAAALACGARRRARLVEPPSAAAVASARLERGEIGPMVALGLLSAALTGVLFLLVLLLVTGWSLSPLEAAGLVSILPVAALAATPIPGPRRARAVAGCALTGAGVLTLAFLPGDAVVWTLAPQVLAGVGLGLAFPALAGGLLAERTPGQAARLLTARHVGITVALAVLAPITAAQLDDSFADLRERGTALVLDARLSPQDKVELIQATTASIDPVDPRQGLREALASQADRFESPEERSAFARLRERADDLLIASVNQAFVPAFLICGALGLAAALAVRPPPRGRPAWVAAGIGVAALALPAAQAAALPHLEPAPVRIADPCEDRELPDTGGLGGELQDTALRALDRAACEVGSSREELALALVDEDRAREFERRYGVNPRSLRELLETLLPILLR